MIDTDLELRVRDWLAADAAVIRTPPSLRVRVFDLPAMPVARRSFLNRFSSGASYGALAAAGVAAIVVTSMFLNLFDVPVGADGEPCNNRQIQRALDQLRDAEGYRYVNREQLRQLDPDAEVSFDDPQFVWTDAWTSEGAYLAPDRVHDAPAFTLPSLYNRGYIEHLQVGGATYQLQDIEGVETWVELENWPTANLVNGYVANAFPLISIPGVTALEWRDTPVPDDLPGTGGCTAAALIPQDDSGLAAPVPSHLIRQRIIALRVDIGSGRPSTVYLGPSVTSREGDGDHRNWFEMAWTTPKDDEFVAPTDTVPDPNLGTGGTPPPTPSPLPVDPSAWAPVELAAGGGAIASVVLADDRYVAVGGSYTEEEGNIGMIWTSTDGTTWDVVSDPGDLEGLNFDYVAWDGEALLALGYRSHENPDDPQLSTFRPETWVSTDGVTWERGGEIGPAEETGEVANPGRPIAAGPGWVAGGSIWTMAENLQRPAFFTSPDGEHWTTIELDDVGSGSLGTVLVLTDGRLFATGCESPSPTNAGQFGESCYVRPWHSDDGENWTPGSTLEVEIGAVARWGDLLIAVGRDADPGGQNQFPGRLMTSADGTTWTDLPGFDGGADSVADIRVVEDELIIDGQLTDGGMYPYATAWRSTDGAEWEPISLGLPTGGTGSFINAVIDTPNGLVFLGQMQIGETDSMPVMWVEP